MGYAASPDSANPKFTGQRWDYETGLDYFNARYYSTAQGRFQSSDPGNAGSDPITPQTWNGYGYVTNSPLTLIDPSGMMTCFAYIGVETGNPVAAGIGAAIDIGELFVGLFGFGGGGAPPTPTWTVTAYGQSSAQTAAPYSFSALGIGVDTTALVIPGLVFYAEAIASAGNAAVNTQAQGCPHKIEQSVYRNLKPTKLINLLNLA